MVQPGPLRATAGLLTIGALLVAGEAFGANRLSVARAEQASSCPDTAALTHQIEAVLGRPAFSGPSGRGQPELGFDVEVFAEGEGFGAIIRVTGSKRGQRALHDAGPGCAGLGDALAVTIAMLLDEHGPLDQPEPPPAEPPRPEPPPAPEPRAPRAETSLRAWLGAGLSAGLTPEVGPLVSGGLSLRLGRRWSVGLEGMWIAPSDVVLPPGSVEVSLLAAKARGCFRPVSGRFLELGGCALLGGGVFRAEGSSYAITRVARPGWAALGAGVEAGGALGAEGSWSERLGWRLTVDGLVTTREQAFVVQDVGVTPPLPRVGMTATAGLALTIW